MYVFLDWNLFICELVLVLLWCLFCFVLVLVRAFIYLICYALLYLFCYGFCGTFFLIVCWGVFLIAFIFYLGGERLDVVPFRTVSCLSGLACHVATGAGFRGGVYLRFFFVGVCVMSCLVLCLITVLNPHSSGIGLFVAKSLPCGLTLLSLCRLYY